MAALVKRRWIWALIALLSISVTGLCMSWPKEPLLARLSRIHEGMTLQQVEAILGPANTAWTPHCRTWRDEHAVVSIYFDNVATSISVAEVFEVKKPPGVLERMQGWLHRFGM